MKLYKDIITKQNRTWTNNVSKSIIKQNQARLWVAIAIFLTLLVQISIYLLLGSYNCNNLHLHNDRIYPQCRTETDCENLPTIYVITPTYSRHVQKAELIRLSHTFLLVPKLHWLIVEDSRWPTDLVTQFVNRLRVSFKFETITHLQAQTPRNFKIKSGEPTWKYPRGVWQRNKALDWIRGNVDDLDQNGVIYFADDDNTYDLELFDEIRRSKRVSVWPVAFVGGLLVEKPIVNKNNQVESFNSMWKSDRPFPIDMAGFAISIRLFRDNVNASFSSDQPIGYVESHFLGQFVKSFNELEPGASGCKRVLVWHTKTQKPTLHEEIKLSKPSTADIIW